MHAALAIVGLLIILLTLWEAFESIILPRRVTRPLRLARMYYRVTWKVWTLGNKCFRSASMRERHLSYYGPLSLLGLFATWAALLVFAFGLLQWAAGSAMNTPGEVPTFRTDIYMSGTTFFTLGLGDITPRTSLARVITVAEGGTGFAFLGLMISYLPTLYGAFSQRELNISLLDARAGSPPTAGELLRRHAHFEDNEVLTPYLQDWEVWAAQLMESHLSYPVLCYFRSQHDNQSWLAAFAAVLDVSALLIAYGEGTAKWQSQLTFAIARHAVADLCEVLKVSPKRPAEERLPPKHLARVRNLLVECRASNRCGPSGDKKLAELREMYEPHLNALSQRLLMPVPTWGVGDGDEERWKHTAWGKITSDPETPHGSSVEPRHF